MTLLNARLGVKLRVLEDNGHHVRLAVWTGRNAGAYGKAGELTVRSEDWPTLRAAVGRMASPNLLVIIEDAGASSGKEEQHP